ncbi:hypothetical protein [Salinarimonas soli]|nr:hypothetical protein [Salinarimonas soli]
MPRLGESPRIFARRALNYGDQNAAALADTADVYERLRESYAAPTAPE